MQISRAEMYSPHVIDTLIVAEMGLPPDQFERAAKNGFNEIGTLLKPHEEVYLRVAEYQVVKGWLSIRFKIGDTTRTFWTWDKRYAIDLPLGGTMPGFVEPIGWCEIE